MNHLHAILTFLDGFDQVEGEDLVITPESLSCFCSCSVMNHVAPPKDDGNTDGKSSHS